ncbi:uncharacterized protein LOC117321182 [Pecten maximus]|uniref:uncharacterized protein LOC117321182 n=1 Tax=Pecten maximus TaxID=6579 RepID=UPI0014583BE7|nr:uncharacterized protein LOC117321182 [Pecten maximus]
MEFTLEDLVLKDGAMYSVKVICTNNALLSTHHESPGVIVDTSAPVMTQVRVGVVGNDEYVDENGNILHVDHAPLRVYWAGFDANSGITHYYIGVGTAAGDVSLTNGVLDTKDTSIVLENVNLDVFDLSQKIYYVTVWAKNGAGLMSRSMSSKPIKVVEANVPGNVNDGFKGFSDSDMETDLRSIGMSFNGFRSAACNIVRYEWAAGSEPYFSDIVPFSNFGIVLQNQSFGHAQINIKLEENVLYYITVRATTGHGCHEEYIVSTSDGFKIDSTDPVIVEIAPPENDTNYIHHAHNLFLGNAESPVLYWGVLDSSAITSMKWAAGSLPYMDDLHVLSETLQYRLQLGDLSVSSGETVWIYVIAEDAAGNTGHALSSPITSDITAPLISSLSCDPTISMNNGVLSCFWHGVEEFESKLMDLEVAIGTSEDDQDIQPYTSIHVESRHWSKDIKTEIGSLDLNEIYVRFRVSNILNFVQDYSVKVDIDTTPPVVDSVVITTTMDATHDGQTTPIKCQIPTTYVEVTLGAIEDTESPITRVEISLGTDVGEEDIMQYRDVDIESTVTHFTFTGLSLEPGTGVYAKTRIHNSVGLYATVISNKVLISQPANLAVHDGLLSNDRDVQKELHILDGEWYYTGLCEVRGVEWSIFDSTGDILQHFQQLPDTTGMFYNDELSLSNGITYMNVIKVTDYLNRTTEKTSDGITVRIQPPSPGYVRDGLGEDINYQFANEHLSGNWNEFGDETSSDPTQLISHYEAAIGNDVRYTSSIANVHNFVSTGLNKFITFNSLDLTKRTVTYYITVRAYSISGSYEEAYSNGIKVGFQEGIRGGVVNNSRYQHETDRLSFFWSGFESDIGLSTFFVGIVSGGIYMANKSFPLEELTRFVNDCDAFPLTNVNADTFFDAENLTLIHGQTYQPLVVAADDAGECKAVIGERVMVDSTPPFTSEATLLINGRESSTFTYINSSDTVIVDWKNISDPESGISYYIVEVYEYLGCNGNGNDTNKELLKSITVSSETQVNFRKMNLASDRVYILGIEAVNNAGLSKFVNEVHFRVDVSKPMGGTVKIADDWSNETSYQSSKSSIKVWIAIARSEESFSCPSQVQLLPNDGNGVWWHEDSKCDNHCVYIANNILRLKIGYNIALTSIDTGVITSDDVTLRKGEYTAEMNVARGNNTITSFFIGSSQRAVSTHLEPPVPDDFSSVTIEYDTEISNRSDTTTLNNGTVENEETAELVGNAEDIDVNGCGVSIIGERQVNSRSWDGLFWCVDMYGRNKQWFKLGTDPTDQINSFTVRLLNSHAGTWDLDLLINGKQEAVLSGITLPQQAKLYFHTSTNNGYSYPKEWHDPFHAYVTVTDVYIPTAVDSLCQHGRGFFDNESNIQSIQLGISDGPDKADNILPFQNVQTFCQKCTSQCSIGCDEQCSFNTDFELFSFHVSNLNLQEAVIENIEDDVIVKNDTTYYAIAKVTNFAGDESISYSNGIVVDTTPPVCEPVKCVDPAYSSTEETNFIGTHQQIGAYWSCIEDISELKETVISVISLDDGLDVHQEENIGLESSFNIVLKNGTLFQDKKQYRFNLRISNTAGLSSSYFCDVTALFSPPAIDHLQVTTFFTAVADNASSVEFIEQNDRLGVSWINDDDGVEFYEMKVGSEPGKGDIIPLAIIGVNKSSSFYILNDEIWIDGVRAPWNVSDLAESSTDNLYNTSDNAPMFLMEPGRCIYITILARGPSRLASTVHKAPLCIARSVDAKMKSTTQTHIVVHAVQNAMTTVQEKTDDLSDVVLNFTGFSGDAIVGWLSASDMTTSYGSAASATFLSYITNPNITTEMTSRILKHRILRFLDQTFFISPAPSYEFLEIDVKVAFNLTLDQGIIPVLAVWITDENGTGHWDVLDQTCTSGDYEIPDDGYIIFKVCEKLLSEISLRMKRSTRNQVNTPFQFGVFLINETYSNTAPVLDTSVLTIYEDTSLDTVQLLWSDAESDSVTFDLSPSHQNDSINITTDGRLSFTPPLHYADVFQVSVILKENTSHAEKLETYGVLDIEVANVNDPPILLFIHPDGSVSDSRQIHNDTFFLESNQTQYDIGTLTVYDFDDNDTFVFFEMAKRSGQITNDTTVIIQGTTNSGVEVYITDSEYVKQSSHASVKATSRDNLTGEVHFHFRVRDQDEAFSHEYVAVVYFLFNPCVHGTCGPINVDGPPCNSTVRSETFEPYYCVCEKGYDGDWCQEEINECETIGCSWMHHCTDKIGAVECTMNYEKMVPITVFSCLAFISLAVGIWIFGRKKCHKSAYQKKVNVDSFGSRTNFAFEDMEGAVPGLAQLSRPPESTIFPNQRLQNKKPQFTYTKEHTFLTDMDDIDCPQDDEYTPFDQRYLNRPKEDKQIFRDPTNMGSFGSLRSGPFFVKHAWLETKPSFDSTENGIFDEDGPLSASPIPSKQNRPPISTSYPSPQHQ